MHIRIASDKDEKQIKAFSLKEWPAVDVEHFGRNDVMFDKKKFTYIADEQREMMGYIIIETDMGVCYIDSIITGQSSRGRGVGTALMQAAEEKAIKEGCHKMFLVTGADWHAKNFYESLGYTKVAVLKNHYDGKDFVQMEKFLSLK